VSTGRSIGQTFSNGGPRSSHYLKQSTFELSWDIDDERSDHLPSAGRVQVDQLNINLLELGGIWSSNNCLTVQLRNCTVVVTGTLKYTSTPSRVCVLGDKLYEWTRGAALSG